MNTWQALTPHSWPWFLLAALAVGLFLLALPAIRRQRAPAWRASGAVFLGATAYFLFMGTQRWTYMNGCFYRYCHPVVFLLQGGVLIFAMGPFVTSLAEWMRRYLGGVAAACLLIAALASYHPSLRASHAALERSMGQCTEDILAARCTHVAGNYWKVWPAVYHANLQLGTRHEKRVVWGITGRSELTRKYWQKLPLDKWRIAVPADAGPNAEAVAGHFGFPPASECGAYPQLPGQTERVLGYFKLPPLVVVEKRRTIWVLAPQTAGNAMQSPPLTSAMPLGESGSLP